MPYQLWFQFNSKNNKEFENCNKPLVTFLWSILPTIVSKIRTKIDFQLVDVSKDSDIKQASKMGINDLPVLRSGEQNIAIGIKEIRTFLARLAEGKSNIMKGGNRNSMIQNRISRNAVTDDDEDDNEDMRPVRSSKDEEEIEEMWKQEIIDSSGEEEDGNDDANERLARATAFTKKRERDNQPSYGRRRGKNAADKSSSKLKQRGGEQKRPPSRTHRMTPHGSADRNGGDDEQEGFQPNRSSKSQGKNNKTSNKRDNVEASTADISRSLNPKSSDAKQEDDLMTQFWENNSETQY